MHTKSAIGACVFDLGGVVRSEWEDYIREQFIPRFQVNESDCQAAFRGAWELIEARSGDPRALETEWAEFILERLPVDLAAGELSEGFRDSIRFYDADQSERTLAWLRDEGVVLAIASNDTHPFFEAAWEQLALGRFFERTRTCVSCFLGCTKNDSRFFEDVASRLSVAPECTVFIDDRAGNVQRAEESVGFVPLLVPTGSYAPRYTHQMLARLLGR